MKKLLGLARGMCINGEGEVAWCMMDKNGHFWTITTPAYLVRRSPVRLLATHPVVMDYPPETIQLDAQKLTFTGVDSDPERGRIEVVYNQQNNLPISIAH